MAAAFHEIRKPVNTSPLASSRDMIPTSNLRRHCVQGHAWTRCGVMQEDAPHAIGLQSVVLAILQLYSWYHFQRRSKAELNASPCGAPCCSRPSQGPMLTEFVSAKAINTMRIESKQMQVHPGSSHRPRIPLQANRLWGTLTMEIPLENQNPERASHIAPNWSTGRCRKQSVISAATPQPESIW